MKTISPPYSSGCVPAFAWCFPSHQDKRIQVTLLASLVLLVSGLTGCAHSRVVSGIEIAEGDVAFVQPGVTGQDELARAIGYGGLNRPTWSWRAPRAIAYVWETSNGSSASRLSFDPTLATTWVQQSERAYCVVFDENDRVVRTAFFKSSNADKLKAVIERWLDARRGGVLEDLRIPLPGRLVR